jgi:chaperonin cofactor prefoldin
MNEELYDIISELSTRIGRLGERVKALEEKSKKDDERITALEKKSDI